MVGTLTASGGNARETSPPSRESSGAGLTGLDHADSDTDRRGVFLDPMLDLLPLLADDLPPATEQVPDELGDRTLHEALRFACMALGANPTVSELL